MSGQQVTVTLSPREARVLLRSLEFMQMVFENAGVQFGREEIPVAVSAAMKIEVAMLTEHVEA